MFFQWTEEEAAPESGMSANTSAEMTCAQLSWELEEEHWQPGVPRRE